MSKNRSMKLIAMLLTLSLSLFAGCAGGSQEPEDELAAAKKSETAVKKTIAWINPRSGSDMGGSAIFIANPDGTITLQVTLQQAPPGVHAVHIHETGDCSADDASSAGGHWNPTGEDHGQWGEGVHHLGDIGNVEVNEEGDGNFELTTDRWTMGGGAENDVLGKAVIVHADADDFTTQPTGAAGGRIGCGVIMIPQT